MRAKAIESAYFSFDGRGPSLSQWIHDGELYLPESDTGFGSPPGSIVGAQYVLPDSQTETNQNEAGVLFEGMQVIQIVSEEVHSYWHREFSIVGALTTGVWEIEDSEYKSTNRAIFWNRNTLFWSFTTS